MKVKTEWTTFHGKKASFDTIDHQHLSNIFYFWKYALDIDPERCEEDFKLIQFYLDDRFNGQLLSYRPHSKFTQELEMLRDKGYLKEDGKIIVNGTMIGEVTTTADFNFIK